nr:transposase [Actinomyces trachealis]
MPEYRREAANLVIDSDRPIARVAKEIGVSSSLLGRWVKIERERQGVSDSMSDSDLRTELARARRALAEVKMDNEFLSKAAAFFAAKQHEQKSSN